MMKILLIIDSLGSGGAQRQILNLAQGLKKRNHEVELFYYNSESDFFLKKLSDSKIKFHKSEKSKMVVIARHLKIILNLRKLLKQDFDAIISFMHIPSIYSCLAKVGIKRGKLIVCERNSSLANTPFLIKLLFYFSCLFSDSIVANSITETLLLKKRFPNKKEIHTIWNGYSTNKLNNENNLKNVNLTNKLLVIGRITFQKNGYNLLKSMKLFYDKNGWIPEINWAGRIDINDKKSKMMKEKMDQILNSNPIINSNLNFLGEVHDVEKLYKESDALIHVSRYEGFANAICESMLNNCMVVCSRVCDNDIVIDSTRGVLCNHLEPDSIFNSIDSVYKMNTQTRIEILNNAKKFALEKFSLEKMTKLYEDVILN